VAGALQQALPGVQDRGVVRCMQGVQWRLEAQNSEVCVWYSVASRHRCALQAFCGSLQACW
jgi:hypothetical protein